jgi:hypothetical protein
MTVVSAIGDAQDYRIELRVGGELTLDEDLAIGAGAPQPGRSAKVDRSGVAWQRPVTGRF